MNKSHKSHDAVFKGKVALEAIKEEKTFAELSSVYGIHANQIGQWKKHLMEGIPTLFSDKRKKSEKEEEALKDELYRQIGKLKVELEWIKKKSQMFR